MCRTGTFELIGSLVLTFQQQGSLLLAHETEDRPVHLGRSGRGFPSVARSQHIQCPQVLIVALGGYHSLTARYAGNDTRQFVAAADMSRKNGNNEAPRAVHIDYRRVGILIPYAVGDASYADTQCSDEHDRFEVGEMRLHEAAVRTHRLASFHFSFNIYDGIAQFSPDCFGYGKSRFGNNDNGCSDTLFHSNADSLSMRICSPAKIQ